jgi:hypothetical protein
VTRLTTPNTCRHRSRNGANRAGGLVHRSTNDDLIHPFVEHAAEATGPYRSEIEHDRRPEGLVCVAEMFMASSAEERKFNKTAGMELNGL